MGDDRQKKVLLMKISIVILMVALFSIWAYNLKNVWLNQKKFTSTDVNNNGTGWSSLKADLSQVLTDAKNQLKEIEKIRAEKKKSDQNALLNNLLGGVDELSAAASPIAATSSATSTAPIATTTPPAGPAIPIGGAKDNNKNCPEYINCMPTIGVARPCQIPAGCEGITFIAY
jgi:hypothetical protein